ncbi:MAG: aminomethyl-transferring glycine dehydrogenase subunit GcvPA [Dehalobacterium sp.]
MEKGAVVYPYIPNSVPEIKAEMLKEVGARDVMDLYEEIPDELLFKGKLNLPEPIKDEFSIKKHVEGILAKNKNCSEYINFLGAGCARHFVPAVCDEMLGRGELLTCYGAESWADHGKHQIFFEYQSMMAELLDMDFLTVPLYDGGQAVATSLCMANRLTGRKKVLLPASMNPEHLMLTQNYCSGIKESRSLELVLVNMNPLTGLMDMNDLRRKISPEVAAVLIENPTYLGVIEAQAEEIGSIAREAGAEFIVYTDPITLGVMEAPANYGATLTIGDIHTLGLHLAGGGMQGGFIACFDDMKYMNEFKEMVTGLTETTLEGEYGYAQVLIERTHYAEREKGKEFTGTGTNLWMVAVAVYLAQMGPRGMKEVGTTIMQNAQYAAQQLNKIPGVKLQFSTPFFKEFVVNFDLTGKSTAEINAKLLENKIFGGLDLSRDFPEIGQSALFCVTEVNFKEEIDQLECALRKIVSC